MRIGVAGFNAECFLEAALRRLRSAQLEQRVAQIALAVGVGGLKPARLPIVGQGRRPWPLAGKGQAQVEVRVDVVWIGPQPLGAESEVVLEIRRTSDADGGARGHARQSQQGQRGEECVSFVEQRFLPQDVGGGQGGKQKPARPEPGGDGPPTPEGEELQPGECRYREREARQRKPYLPRRFVD